MLNFLSECSVLADYYQVSSLTQHCLVTLRSLLAAHPDSAWDLLLHFHLLSTLIAAQTECFYVIDSQIKSIDEWTGAKLERFTRLDRSLLCELLNRDTLHVPERDLISAVVRWTERACAEDRVEPGRKMQLAQALEALLAMVKYFKVSEQCY